jgi:hypothetical protein
MYQKHQAHLFNMSACPKQLFQLFLLLPRPTRHLHSFGSSSIFRASEHWSCRRVLSSASALAVDVAGPDQSHLRRLSWLRREERSVDHVDPNIPLQ